MNDSNLKSFAVSTIAKTYLVVLIIGTSFIACLPSARIDQEGAPHSAKRAGIGGTVIIEAFIDSTGRATEFAVMQGYPNSGLDEAAIDAIRKTSWKPVKQGGKPMGRWVSVPVTFRSETAPPQPTTWVEFAERGYQIFHLNDGSAIPGTIFGLDNDGAFIEDLEGRLRAYVTFRHFAFARPIEEQSPFKGAKPKLVRHDIDEAPTPVGGFKAIRKNLV